VRKARSYSGIWPDTRPNPDLEAILAEKIVPLPHGKDQWRGNSLQVVEWRLRSGQQHLVFHDVNGTRATSSSAEGAALWVIAKSQGCFPMHLDQVSIDPRCLEGIEDLPFKFRSCPDRQVEPRLFVRVQNEKIGVGTKELAAILNVF
jgi:hypothetical protein